MRKLNCVKHVAGNEISYYNLLDVNYLGDDGVTVNRVGRLAPRVDGSFNRKAVFLGPTPDGYKWEICTDERDATILICRKES